ncbi:hypothetical protein J3A83DRAFT_4384632 [Scleroderma citrinum]
MVKKFTVQSSSGKPFNLGGNISLPPLVTTKPPLPSPDPTASSLPEEGISSPIQLEEASDSDADSLTTPITPQPKSVYSVASDLLLPGIEEQVMLEQLAEALKEASISDLFIRQNPSPVASGTRKGEAKATTEDPEDTKSGRKELGLNKLAIFDDSLKEFEKKLEEHFQIGDIKAMALITLLSIQMGNHSLNQYITSFDNLLTQAELFPEDQAATTFFRKGLHPSISQRILGLGIVPKTVTEWKRAAMEVQAAMATMRMFEGKASNSDKIFLWKNQGYNSSHKRQECNPNAMDVDNMSCPQPNTRDVCKALLCYNCNKEGHFAKDCKQLRKQGHYPPKNREAKIEELQKELDCLKSEGTSTSSSGVPSMDF